jgi:hypothetical protein
LEDRIKWRAKLIKLMESFEENTPLSIKSLTKKKSPPKSWTIRYDDPDQNESELNKDELILNNFLYVQKDARQEATKLNIDRIDPLKFWAKHETKFPILAKIAKEAFGK